MQRTRRGWGRTALIGSTGYVGGTLSRQVAFDAGFASATIDQIAGQSFDTVICAGAPAAMWRANADPGGDKANLESLVGALAKADIGRLVLISTIAVLADPASGADESTSEFENEVAYGRNRRWLEQALSERFATTIVRLPALFGAGLKKNFLFDLRHPMPAFLKPEAYAELMGSLVDQATAALADVYAVDPTTALATLDRTALDQHGAKELLTDAVIAAGFDATGFTHPDSTFQFYGLDCLANDIDAAMALGLDTLHLAVEPCRADDLAAHLTGRTLVARPALLRTEDMQTRHAQAIGGVGPYLRSRDQVLEAIAQDWENRAW